MTGLSRLVPRLKRACKDDHTKKVFVYVCDIWHKPGCSSVGPGFFVWQRGRIINRATFAFRSRRNADHHSAYERHSLPDRSSTCERQTLSRKRGSGAASNVG